jgi:hypothetical protein
VQHFASIKANKPTTNHGDQNNKTTHQNHAAFPQQSTHNQPTPKHGEPIRRIDSHVTLTPLAGALP